jgi:hypothetical protein
LLACYSYRCQHASTRNSGENEGEKEREGGREGRRVRRTKERGGKRVRRTKESVTSADPGAWKAYVDYLLYDNSKLSKEERKEALEGRLKIYT